MGQMTARSALGATPVRGPPREHDRLSARSLESREIGIMNILHHKKVFHGTDTAAVRGKVKNMTIDIMMLRCYDV